MLAGAVATLERTMDGLAAEMPALRADVERLDEAQRPFVAGIAQYDRELAELQAEQRSTLAPINARLTSLQALVRAAQERASAIAGQMTPLTVTYGSQVERARPQSAALAGAYGEVDRLTSDLSGAANQGDLLKARLAAVDGRALRKFYLLIAAALALIMVVVALWVVAFSARDGGTSSASIVGKWEQTYGNSLCSNWRTVEFLKGNIVILGNSGSWTYSFPQDGYLNVGGNMGETYMYEVGKDTLRLHRDDGYCDYVRLK